MPATYEDFLRLQQMPEREEQIGLGKTKLQRYRELMRTPQHILRTRVPEIKAERLEALGTPEDWMNHARFQVIEENPDWDLPQIEAEAQKRAANVQRTQEFYTEKHRGRAEAAQEATARALRTGGADLLGTEHTGEQWARMLEKQPYEPTKAQVIKHLRQTEGRMGPFTDEEVQAAREFIGYKVGPPSWREVGAAAIRRGPGAVPIPTILWGLRAPARGLAGAHAGGLTALEEIAGEALATPAPEAPEVPRIAGMLADMPGGTGARAIMGEDLPGGTEKLVTRHAGIPLNVALETLKKPGNLRQVVGQAASYAWKAMSSDDPEDVHDFSVYVRNARARYHDAALRQASLEMDPDSTEEQLRERAKALYVDMLEEDSLGIGLQHENAAQLVHELFIDPLWLVTPTKAARLAHGGMEAAIKGAEKIPKYGPRIAQSLAGVSAKIGEVARKPLDVAGDLGFRWMSEYDALRRAGAKGEEIAALGELAKLQSMYPVVKQQQIANMTEMAIRGGRLGMSKGDKQLAYRIANGLIPVDEGLAAAKNPEKVAASIQASIARKVGHEWGLAVSGAGKAGETGKTVKAAHQTLMAEEPGYGFFRAVAKSPEEAAMFERLQKAGHLPGGPGKLWAPRALLTKEGEEAFAKFAADRFPMPEAKGGPGKLEVPSVRKRKQAFQEWIQEDPSRIGQYFVEDLAKQWDAIRAVEGPVIKKVTEVSRLGKYGIEEGFIRVFDLSKKHGQKLKKRLQDPRYAAKMREMYSASTPGVEWHWLGELAAKEPYKVTNAEKILDRIIGIPGKTKVGTRQYLMPRPVAEQMLSLMKSAEAGGTDVTKAMATYLKFLHHFMRPVNNTWREITTIPNPAFAPTNFTGALGMGAMAHGFKMANPEFQKVNFALSLMSIGMGKEKFRGVKTLLPSGEEITLGRLFDMAVEDGAINQLAFRLNRPVTTKSPLPEKLQPFSPLKMLTGASRTGSKYTGLSAAASFTEKYQHLLGYVGFLRSSKPLDRAKALQGMRKWFSDYRTLGPAERLILNDNIGFYNWLQFTMKLSKNYLAEKPAKMAAIEKAKQAWQREHAAYVLAHPEELRPRVRAFGVAVPKGMQPTTLGDRVKEYTTDGSTDISKLPKPDTAEAMTMVVEEPLMLSLYGWQVFGNVFSEAIGGPEKLSMDDDLYSVVMPLSAAFMSFISGRDKFGRDVTGKQALQTGLRQMTTDLRPVRTMKNFAELMRNAGNLPAAREAQLRLSIYNELGPAAWLAEEYLFDAPERKVGMPPLPIGVKRYRKGGERMRQRQAAEAFEDIPEQMGIIQMLNRP
jgi:hypothetical protein